MDATTELNALLETSGAQLIRNGKHKVYKLGNGARFTTASTPSDRRAAENNLSILRKLLGEKKARGRPRKHPVEEFVVEVRDLPPAEQVAVVASEPIPVAPPEPPMPPPPPPSISLKISQMVLACEMERDDLMSRAAALDQHVQMLKTLHQLAETESLGLEHILRQLMPAPKPQVIVQAPLVPRVHIMRDSVLATCRESFTEPFTVDNVLDLMGREVTTLQERSRVRLAIADALKTLYERGLIIRESNGDRGKRALYSNTKER